MVGCADNSWEPPDAGTIMAELKSPDTSLTARVIATGIHGTYIFEIRKIQRGNILTEKTISAPVGYHAHIVSITWSEDGRIVSAKIDHDFGEDNKVFDLHIESIVD